MRRRVAVVTVMAFALTLLIGWALISTGEAIHGFFADSDDPVPRSDIPLVTAPAPLRIDTNGFQADYLIDNAVFYDASTMNEEEIRQYIAKVNAGCMPGLDGTDCLAQAHFVTRDIAPSTWCAGAYEGADDDDAAAVIAGVAHACGINPQVLLVLLEKEQGLLTASGEGLTARRYEAAAGYACPDHADCDPAWKGFFLQVYGAAQQFQRYRLTPATYDFQAGRESTVAYSPDPVCESTSIIPANQATAGLYNYTPYVPNAAVTDGGDDCTSWGNWNFYAIFQGQFGSPTPQRGQ